MEICVDELCISITDDHSRITLKAENNHGNSDYINASPIVSIVYSLWLHVVANICCPWSLFVLRAPVVVGFYLEIKDVSKGLSSIQMH